MSDPRGMYDMTGWAPINCADSDATRGNHKVTPASSLTDPNGTYSSGVVFTEWWTGDQPLLRDYRYSDSRPCEHFIATGPEAARAEEDQ